ncbi:MAG: dTMP kinase [Microcystaceae cyanobacterium]
MKSLFIVFEGIDGSGTSTQAKLLKEHFSARGCPTVISPEPTDSPIGKLIREALKKRLFLIQDKNKFDEQMAYLFAADRHYHLYNDVDGICKLIHQYGMNVITTRYYFSSLAYNCHTQEEFEFISCLNQKFPQPDLVVYIDISIEISLLRLSERAFREIYEHKDKLTKVRQNYHNIFNDYRGLILKIDGAKDKERIHKKIVDFIEEVF